MLNCPEFLKDQSKHKNPENMRAGVLRRWWDKTKRQVVIIGSTPSTANDSKDDRMTMRLNTILRFFGQGGFTVTNITDPLDVIKATINKHSDFKGMKQIQETENSPLTKDSSEEEPAEVKEHLESNSGKENNSTGEKQHIIVMWGGGQTNKARKTQITEVQSYLKKVNCVVLCFGHNLDGSPLLPM